MNPHPWRLWQILDSAFPTGGFAHSGGLEAAVQWRGIRDSAELFEWLQSSLMHFARTQLPCATASHAGPGRFDELDALSEALLSNHVANRASRLQGRAFLTAVSRAFPSTEMDSVPSPPRFGHFAPVFGRLSRRLEIPLEDCARLLVFLNLRGWVSAAVRLNFIGPMEAQAMQARLNSVAEHAAQTGLATPLDQIAQTAPLIDLWQGAQDRLYSRLFQS